MAAGEESGSPAPGLRERKRLETRQRIVNAALTLFAARGYEATTLDAIAADAGIARRTFFYYFESKDDILVSIAADFGALILAALREQPIGKRPLDATRDALISIYARYPTEEMLVIDRLMRSNAAVQARKQANYVQQEQALFAALCERWPQPERQEGLRLVAMMSLGATRLALEALYREAGARPLVTLIEEAFAALRAEL